MWHGMLRIPIERSFYQNLFAIKTSDLTKYLCIRNFNGFLWRKIALGCNIYDSWTLSKLQQTCGERACRRSECSLFPACCQVLFCHQHCLMRREQCEWESEKPPSVALKICKVVAVLQGNYFALWSAKVLKYFAWTKICTQQKPLTEKRQITKW